MFLKTRKLRVGYFRPRQPPRVILEEIDVHLKAGEFICLLGPNGAGKSTLIRTLAGMQPPLSGEISLTGRPLSSLSARSIARRMSLVLTDRPNVGFMPVSTLVALGRQPYTGWRGCLQQDDKAVVWRAMVDVGIDALAHRPVCELSDGERQKVMIARALAQEPEVMLLDEATAFLDLPRRVELMGLLRDLARIGRRAILLSTHDLDLALRCADRLWLLGPGGSLIGGVPEDLVLGGAFAEAFAGSGACFDKGTGAFTLPNMIRGTVMLKGNDVTGGWTCRALERRGYHIVRGQTAPLCVEICHDSGGTTWRLSNGEQRGERVFCLESLLDALETQEKCDAKKSCRLRATEPSGSEGQTDRGRLEPSPVVVAEGDEPFTN